MDNKIFPKVTVITGDADSITSPEISMAENGAAVFLIATAEKPYTVTVKGLKDTDTEKPVTVKYKAVGASEWAEAVADTLELTEPDAYLIAVTTASLAHDELDRIVLTVNGIGGGVIPSAVYAFEVVARYYS